MNTSTFKIYTSVSQLPTEWNAIAANNIFLTTSYLRILEVAAPQNMSCQFIGVFENNLLIGISISQFIDLTRLESFGERDRCLKTTLRNFLFNNFSSHVLFIGNNMLTGQNAIAFSEKAEAAIVLKTISEATQELKTILKKKGVKIHITTYKDFFEDELTPFSIPTFRHYYQFSTQPNMIFRNTQNWKNENDYVAALSKKYRDQFKRARKKAVGIEKRKMDLEDIILHEETIYKLYFHVAKNAPFNTFFLPKNHFRVFKELLKEQFLFYGYFYNNHLIGFNTLIKNGTTLDTYFLGYDDNLQREKMLYLNMLYDMIAYSLKKGFKEITLARTALEIKSSVGAEPIPMFGFMEHSTSFLNQHMDWIFNYLEPKVTWQKRNPFK